MRRLRGRSSVTVGDLEWDYDGLVTTTGHAFRVSNITVTTVRNGKIVASRDYHNHAILAGVVGRLPALVETFTKNTAV